MRYIIPLIVLLTFSCKSQKSNLDIDERLTLIIQDGYFPVESPETHIIKDSKSLKSFYSRINRTRKPGLPIPTVDFSTHSVLVACMGIVNTEVPPVMYIKSETSDEMVVSVQIPEQKKNPDMQSYPFCIYTIADTGKGIRMEIE